MPERGPTLTGYRRCPRPPYAGQPGRCSMCGTSPLPGRRTSMCSDACAQAWRIASSPSTARRHLLALLGHRCWECGTTEGHMSVDHIRPLWSLTDVERGELRWWLPFNLQVLDAVCHYAKSAWEAGQRAEAKRLARYGGA